MNLTKWDVNYYYYQFYGIRKSVAFIIMVWYDSTSLIRVRYGADTAKLILGEKSGMNVSEVT